MPWDAVCTVEGVDEREALEYQRIAYGAQITSVDELLGHRLAAPVGAAVPLGAEYENGRVLEHEP